MKSDLDTLLHTSCQTVLEKYGKDRDWLRYATPWKAGWMIEKTPDNQQISVLNEIVALAVAMGKFDERRVVQRLSELVNS
ncbi:hypothetical protein IPM62_03610 [Candidatus Woesebacteria bacterium]|nr:MAG: hypothetical protein IPM62_03610 [Candidatus Woesebacteria bacterium]